MDLIEDYRRRAAQARRLSAQLYTCSDAAKLAALADDDEAAALELEEGSFTTASDWTYAASAVG
jgi:hypothetical protein